MSGFVQYKANQKITDCRLTIRNFICVARPGFEPRQTEPKSVVLPLYYRAMPHGANGLQI